MSDDEEKEKPNGGEARDERSTLRGVSESVRKAIASGFKSVVQSEEWLRSTIADSMPKELITYMKSATDNTRDEVVRVIGAQAKRFFEGVDIGGEIQKILTTLSFEIKTEIRFIPNDKSVKPDIKFSMRPKRAKNDET